MAVVYRNQITKGYIAPLRYVHDGIRFRYKLWWPEMREAHMKKVRACATEEEATKVVCVMVQWSLVDWNLNYPENHPDALKAGQAVPITLDVITNELMSHVRHRIASIMSCQSESDIDPLDEVEAQMKQLEDRAASRTPEQLMREADEAMVKN